MLKGFAGLEWAEHLQDGAYFWERLLSRKGKEWGPHHVESRSLKYLWAMRKCVPFASPWETSFYDIKSDCISHSMLDHVGEGNAR